MKLLKIALSSLISMSFINVQAQTADEIITKWIDAAGGKDKINRIRTAYIERDLDIMNNIVSGTAYLINGKGYKSETDFNGQKIIDCYTDKGGWSINPLAGQNTAVIMPDDQVKMGQLELDIPGPLFDYTAKGNKVEFQGKEDLNGAGVYKLKVTTPINIEITFFIDSTTYYVLKTIAKMSVNGQDVEVTRINSNFRKTDYGFVMPFSQELSLPGLTLAITNKKIEINKEIDQAIFEMPKK